jgi:hypothetical protein
MKFARNITTATTSEKKPLRCLLFIVVLAFSILPLAFTTPAPAQAPPQNENRFLFIINTSAAMRPMTNGIRDAVAGLLQSHMQGQMRDGDTFGIWTYNDQLHADFPMQTWSGQKQDAMLKGVASWLGQRRYEKKPHLEKVLPAARQIAEMSRVVTLIFIFDGSETMQGTGFDEDINALEKDTGRQMRADHIPFVTVLAARDGKFFDYRVRTPASVSLPRTAEFFPPVQTNAVPVVAATNAPPPAVASKAPEPRHIDIVIRPSAPPVTNPPPAAVPGAVAPTAPPTTPPAPTTVQPTPTPAQPARTPTQPTPTPVQPAPTPTQPTPTPAQPATTPAQPATTPAQPATTPVPPPTSQAVAPAEPARVAVAAPPVETAGRSEATPAVSNPQPATTPSRADESPKQPPDPNTNSTAPAVAAPATPPPPVKPVAQTPVVAPAAPAVEATPPAVAPPPAAPGVASRPAAPGLPTAVAMPSPSDHFALLLIACSLATIALVLVIFLIRRARTPPSLISQSMNRPR